MRRRLDDLSDRLEIAALLVGGVLVVVGYSALDSWGLWVAAAGFGLSAFAAWRI